MVQVGLCAFRHAEIREAHNALLDIQLGGRSKELLAQGLLPQVLHYSIGVFQTSFIDLAVVKKSANFLMKDKKTSRAVP